MTPLFATLSIVDYGVLALFLALLAGLGFYFAGERHSGDQFFLGGRRLGAFPLGLSSSMVILSALDGGGLIAAGYERGLVCLIAPLSVWLVVPWLVAAILPIFRGLELSTIFEYLELRFDHRVRLLATVIYLAWRLAILAAMLEYGSRAVATASGYDIPHWPLVLGLGLAATLHASLGGMKAVAWAGVVQGLVILAGIVVVVASIWIALPGGPGRIAEVAGGLNRMSPAEFTFSSQDPWSLWGALPHWWVVFLILFAADQVTSQRFLSARSVDTSRTACLLGALAITALQVGLIYAGLCLLAFYNDRPQEMRPQWVANVDHLTRGLMKDADGQPLIDPADPLSPQNVDELVRQRKLLRPNSKEPFTDAGDLIDPETGQLVIEKLAMRKPTPGPIRGEIIVAKSAPAQMFPQFVADHLPWGATGLALAALAALAMAGFDAGVHALGGIMLIDVHRRFGLGRRWLARRLGKPPAELGEQEYSFLALPLTIAAGFSAIALAWGLSQVAGNVAMVITAAGTLGAPLLALFLLGLFTRRCTAAGALTALLGGIIVAAAWITWSAFAFTRTTMDSSPPSAIWGLTATAMASLVMGVAASLGLGRRKTNVELRGLVWGCGEPGVLATDEEVTVIGELEGSAELDADGSQRWK